LVPVDSWCGKQAITSFDEKKSYIFEFYAIIASFMTKFTRFDITQDPFELAKKGRTISGSVFSKDMARIKDMIGADAEFAAKLDFGVTDRGLKYVTGAITGEVRLNCQRCLELYTHQLNINFRLGIVASEQQIANLPKEFEPLLVEEEVVFLRDIIEDEIILALPSAPLHSEEECSVKLNPTESQDTPSIVEETKRRPFEGLADLLDKNKG
jgi:uncharacterized protein